jgi:serine protease AprX
MKTILIAILIFVCQFKLQAQTEDAWIYFTDKPDAATYYANPLLMLSQRSLDRRDQQNIDLDIKDVPLHQPYVTQIRNAQGITIIAQSKWLNCVHVQGSQSDIEALDLLSFVADIEFANTALNATTKLSEPKQGTIQADKLAVVTDFEYGSATNQIQMLHGDFLHQNNFTGTGMHIAVIDAGFTNVNTMSSFDRIRNNNQILGTYNFIERQTDVYFRHYHGTMVLSTIAGYVENQFVGTAPDASFYLFISEDGNQEHPYEESLWVEAAEKADSLGVDVLNTSLGYTQFDRTEYNHTYEDLDGQTTFITRGSEIAFSRGMLVVNSAGNEGYSSWHYIGAPADAPSILSIGAVDASGNIAAFSSWGPTVDERVKPDVCAQGQGSAVINTSNNITSGSGTSFSGPILAGVATCFWQAFPDKTNAEIAQAIRESAHLYATPDDHYGYGIPNFETAFNTMSLSNLSPEDFVIYPNPLNGQQALTLQIPQLQPETSLKISTINGQVLGVYEVNHSPYSVDLHNLSQGVYWVSILSDDNVYTQKLIVH